MDGIPVQAVGQTMSDPNAVGACPRPARPGLGGQLFKGTRTLPYSTKATIKL